MRNRLMRVLIAALALAGMTVSGLALRVHNMDSGAAPPCAVSEHWDCGAVNHSRFSYFPPKMVGEEAGDGKVHVPVATLGIIGYGLMFVLAVLGRWWAVLQLAEMGFAAACMLTYLEAFVLEKWCIYCVWSQAIITSIVVATMVALVLRKREGHRLEIPRPAADRVV